MEFALVSGSTGLVGSAVVEKMIQQGFKVVGVDNNSRKDFFGVLGSTTSTKKYLEEKFKASYVHFSSDIKDFYSLQRIFGKFDIKHVIHCAAQPSHDKAASIPHLDFQTNAVGTLNLLECFRTANSKGSFVFLSTNKVYGDHPNRIPLKEQEFRYDYDSIHFKNGISENCSIDQTIHSLFGVSKASADLLVQEYGRYFGIRTSVLRGGCLTGAKQAGVALHGFLNFLIKTALEGGTYKVIGYKGKQVRDQIYSEDVAEIIFQLLNMDLFGEVFNLGGGYENSASILEIINLLSSDFGIRLKTVYDENPRIGDHICYYTDMKKLFSNIPAIKLKTLPEIIELMLK